MTFRVDVDETAEAVILLMVDQGSNQTWRNRWEKMDLAMLDMIEAYWGLPPDQRPPSGS